MRSIQPTQARFHGNRNICIPSSWASAKYVYVRKDSHKHPLQRPYDGPYRVIGKSDKYSTLHVKGRTETVSIDRLKTAFVTQFGNSEEDTPVICSAEPSPTTILGSAPSTVLPVPSSSTLQSDDRPGTVLLPALAKSNVDLYVSADGETNSEFDF